FVVSDDPDFHPADVLEDADGSLLVLDTGSWYTQHCPTGKIRKSPAPGGIYRVSYSRGPRPKDPWGLNDNLAKASNQRLVSLLSDSRPSVRDRAERVLSSRGREVLGILSSLLGKSADRTARQHALRALGSMSETSAVHRIFPSVFDGDPEVAATAVRC